MKAGVVLLVPLKMLFNFTLKYEVLGLDAEHSVSTKITRNIFRNVFELDAESWTTWIGFNKSGVVIVPIALTGSSEAKI